MDDETTEKAINRLKAVPSDIPVAEASIQRFRMEPLVRYDEELNELICESESLAHLIQLATAGNPKKIRALINSPESLRKTLVQDRTYWMRSYLLSRALQDAESEDPRIRNSGINTAFKIIQSVQPKENHAETGPYRASPASNPRTARTLQRGKEAIFGVEGAGVELPEEAGDFGEETDDATG